MVSKRPEVCGKSQKIGDCFFCKDYKMPCNFVQECPWVPNDIMDLFGDIFRGTK